MPVPSAISDLSQTESSNSPAGSESPITADNYLRQYAAFIATLRDGKGFTDQVTLASATTTDIGAQNAMFVEISGTTTITSFGTTYNGPRFIRFTGALTLTHNATTLNLPGSANITTAAGDSCVAIPNSTPNGWNVVSYMVKSLAPGAANTATSATSVTTATTATKATNIAGGAGGQIAYQTSTDNTAFLAAGTSGQFFTSGGTSAPTWTTAKVIKQTVYSITGAVGTGTTTIPADDTIPQNTEGNEYMTLAITPTNSSNILVIDACGNFSHSAGPAFIMALFQDTTANALSVATYAGIGGTFPAGLTLSHTMVAGTTSATTFKIRAGSSSAGTTTFNGASSARQLGGVINSFIRITEYQV